MQGRHLSLLPLSCASGQWWDGKAKGGGDCALSLGSASGAAVAAVKSTKSGSVSFILSGLDAYSDVDLRILM